MISYGQLDVIIRARLDAESSQRYLPEQDILPAINSATSRLQTGVGWALANRKGSEEALRDMTKIAVYQTDAFGALVLDDPLLGYTIANVLGVYVEPDLQQPVAILPLPGSQYRADALWAGAGSRVQRTTLEKVPVIKTNSMMQGNEVFATNTGRRTYAYYLNNGRVWVLPKSYMGQKLVGVSHIQKFAPMTDTNSTVDLPPYMADLLATWACEFLSWKQGAGPDTLNVLASKDAAVMFNFSVN